MLDKVKAIMRNHWKVDPAQSLRRNLEDWEMQAAIGREPSTVAYNKRLAVLIRGNCPEELDTPCQSITAESVARLADRLGRFSASQFNHLVNVLRVLIPAARFIRRRREVPKIALLPPEAGFHAMLAELDRSRNPTAGLVARLLAYTGLRIGEALSLRPEDVLANGLLVRKSKSGRPRLVPYVGQCREVVEQLLAQKNGHTGLIAQKSIRKALAGAAQRAGVPRLSHHDFRRLFATRCIESRVDLPTAARWLGHSDGGALLGKTYFHLLDDHSAAMAQKVKI